MGKRVTATLSVESIRAAQKAIMEYRDNLAKKCELLVDKLLEIGISTGKMRLASSTGSEEKSMAQYITFSKSIDPERYGVKGVMVATSGIIKSEWMTADGTKTADVSPLLMVEFGSGPKANRERTGKASSEFGMGQGTFPEQTHAFDGDGWYYQTTDGVWHHSRGISPAMPMDFAALEISDNVTRIAKEVFES